MGLIHFSKLIVRRRDDGSLYNARGEAGDTTTLQRQLLENGQRSPIIVSLPNFDGEVCVTQGHRRERAFAALRENAKQGLRVATAHQDVQGIEAYKEEVERWSYLWFETNNVEFHDIRNLLIDMDAGTVQKDVDPVSLGYAIRQRIETDGFTLDQCCDAFSVSLDDAQAMINLTSGRTSKSVLDAVRSGQMKLGTYKRKFQRMSEITQERVLKAAREAVEGNPRSHGVVSQDAITKAIKDLSGVQQQPMFPDFEVVPQMATAYRSLEAAFGVDTWSESTQEMADHWLDKILSLIDKNTKNQVRMAA